METDLDNDVNDVAIDSDSVSVDDDNNDNDVVDDSNADNNSVDDGVDDNSVDDDKPQNPSDDFSGDDNLPSVEKTGLDQLVETMKKREERVEQREQEQSRISSAAKEKEQLDSRMVSWALTNDSPITAESINLSIEGAFANNGVVIEAVLSRIVNGFTQRLNTVEEQIGSIKNSSVNKDIASTIKEFGLTGKNAIVAAEAILAGKKAKKHTSRNKKPKEYGSQSRGSVNFGGNVNKAKKIEKPAHRSKDETKNFSDAALKAMGYSS